MAISHCCWHLVVQNGNFTLLLTSSGQEWQFHIATDVQLSRMAISHCYWHLVVNKGNFTLLLTSSGQEWQFGISTVRVHIGRSTPPGQSSIDALNTATWNLAHLMADLYIYRQYTYTHGRWTPQLSIDTLNTTTPNLADLSIYRQCIYPWQMDPPSQSNIDALHTITPTARSRTMHLYRRQMDPPSIKHRCIEYCYTKYISIAQCNWA